MNYTCAILFVLAAFVVLEGSAVGEDVDCDYEAASYNLCLADAHCKLNMQLETLDYTAFKYVLSHHVIQVTPVHAPTLVSQLKSGSVCNNSAIQTAWLHCMRLVRVCKDADHSYDIELGCVSRKPTRHHPTGPYISGTHVLTLILIAAVACGLWYHNLQLRQRAIFEKELQTLKDQIGADNSRIFMPDNEIRTLVDMKL